MARLILSSNENVGVSSGTVEVFGTTSGAETVEVFGGTIILDGSFGGGRDTIKIAGNAASWTAIQDGTSVLLTSGTSSISIPVGTAGSTVAFADASRTLKIDAGKLMLGTQAIGLTAATVDAGSGGAGGGAGGTTGQTFTLTTSTDVVPGLKSAEGSTSTSGDDTIIGTLVGAGGLGTTLQAGDNLNGGAGSDKLILTITGDAGAAFTISGVATSSLETIQLNNFDADTTADGTVVDMALMSGVSTFSLNASSANGDTKLDNVTEKIAAEMRNGSGDLKVAYVSSVVSGTADSQSLTVSNLTGGTFTADGVESLAISSELVKSTIADVVSNKLKSISISGSKDLTVSSSIDFAATANSTSVDGTIDASAFTGSLDVSATTAQTVSIKGGSGNDSFNLGGTLTKYDLIDGGAGSNTLKIAETANRTFVDNQISNIQTLEVAVTTNNLTDLDVKALADTIAVKLTAGTTDKDVTVNNLGVGQTVSVVNDSASTKELGDVAVNLEVDTGTSDSISVNLIAKTDADQTLDMLTVDSGAEALVLDVSGATTAGNEYTLTSLIADGAKSITIKGSGNFVTQLNETQAGSNVTTTIDASQASGTFVITENVTNDLTIKGSAGQNTFQMGSTLNEKDTLVGGASTKDSVSATVGSATTATTGKFNLSAIETLALTSTVNETATVDLSASTGVTKVTVAASGATTGAQVLNLKGLAAGTVVATTDQQTNDFDGSLSVALANATGTADALTVELNNSASADNFALTTSGVETVTLKAASTGINASTGVNVSGVDASTLYVTGGTAASAIDLTEGTSKLNKTVTAVDASGFAGKLTITASDDAAATGVTINAGTLGVDTNALEDTLVGTTATGVTDKLVGTLSTSASAADFVSSFSNFETYELTINDGVDIVADANEGLGDGDNVVTSITLKGGNSTASYTAADAIDGTKLTSFDASAFNGTTSINVSASIAGNVTLKAGVATDDALTFSAVNGLVKTTTGKLTAAGFETVALLTATASSTIDASGLSGLKTLAIENDQDVTISGLAAGVAVQLGANSTTGTDDYIGKLTISLADESGTADSLTVNLVETTADDALDATLVTTGIETVTIKHNAAAGAGNGDLDVSGVKASKLVLTGGLAGESLDLTKGTTTLSVSTVTVDASALASDLVLAANANKATTLIAKGANVSFTGGSAADIITVGKVGGEISSAITTIDGGTSNDTLTVYAKASASLANVNAVETINIVAAATGADYTVTTFATSNGGNDASTVKVAGGEAGKVVTLGGNIDDHTVTIDASGSVGSVAMTWAAGALVQTNTVDAIEIKGGQGSKDKVSASFTANAAANTGTFTMSGVETLNVFSTSQGAATGGNHVVDLTNVTGLSALQLATDTTNARSVTVTGLASSTTVELGDAGAEFAGVTAKLDLADATGSTDALSVKLVDTNDDSSTATIQTDGVESLTLTLANSTEDHTVALANTNTNAAKLVVTGANTGAELTLSSLAAAYTNVDASGLKGAFVMADGSRSGTAAATIIGGSGDDTIIVKSANDVVDGGSNPATTPAGDTLKVVASFVLGGIQVDLSSSTDQILTFNGNVNSAAQKGFENINLSGVSGTFGAAVDGSSGANSIVGTANADVISGGAGADTITGGVGADSIDLTEATAAIDTVVIGASDSGITVATADTITGFVSGSDKLKLGVAGAATAAGASTEENYSEAASAVADFATALTAANTALSTINTNETTATIGYNFQADSSNGYLFVDTDSDGDADQVIVLVGVTASTFAAGDIYA